VTQRRDVTVGVNGTRHHVTVEPRRLLVDWLRDDLGLTGTHVGCDTAQCGACIVIVDGTPAKACNVLTVQTDGASIETIESLTRDGQLHPLQEAFCASHAVQCGYCTPGMIMTAYAFIQHDRHPDDVAIRLAIDGTLCRCTGYQNIVDAIRNAADAASSSGEST
jgi:aerobic carbon-monoxide dehydrogenase small subunit